MSADVLTEAGIACAAADEALGPVLRLAATDMPDALAALARAGYDQLVDLFGTDTGEAVEMTYHVRILAEREDLYLKSVTPYDGELPSVWQTYPAALYPEREAAELLGLELTGHPNPKRLLTTDAVPPLLRKSVAIRTEEEVRIR